ncbi:hypothetical protein C0J52_17649 [Blattella germanica]|nr:hypothetical protein C0J52_17649 [Blattella germanica]
MNRRKEIQIKSQREQINKRQKDRKSCLVSDNRDGTNSAIMTGLNSHKEEMRTNSDRTLSVQNLKTMGSKPYGAVTVPKTKPLQSSKVKPKKVPEIKHTLASKLRLIKANPLLEVRGIITVPAKYKKGLDKSYIVNKQEKQMPAPSLKKRLREDELETGVFPLPVTPNISETPRRSRYDAFFKSMATPKIFTPTPEVMREQLSQWLKKRGKSLVNFHHLHCFGLHANHGTYHKPRCNEQDFTPKRKFQSRGQMNTPEPNARKRTILQKSSKAGISNMVAVSEFPEENKENVYVENTALTVSPQDVLEDLLKVIHIGFPVEQCNHWLAAIRKSFPEVKEVPVYWECLAGLEETRGDLNLSTDLGMSASTLNYVVTPVRRSTRASASRYSSTPGLLCVKSLNNLEPNIRKSMVFKPNYALD